MAEHKDREPFFGKLDALDVDAAIPSGLRAEAKGRNSGGVSVAAAGDAPPRAETGLDAELAVSAAVGLTTRTRPSATEPDPSGPGNPGAAIRAARDRLGLKASELAFRTRLPQRVIEDLEANRFEAMAPTYARGYLRAVARELDDDADRWIRAYENLGYTELVPRATVKRDLANGRASLDSRIWYWIVAVIMLLVLGLGIHAWTDGTRVNPLASLSAWFGGAEPIPMPDDPSPGPALSEPLLPEPAAEIDWAPDPEPFGTPSESPALASEAGQANDGLVAEVDETAVSEVTPANGQTATHAPIAGEGEHVLALSFQATSWVEIRSRGDQVELRGIFHPGDRQTVALALPARIVLGNAPGVRLERDGEVVDLVPHTREDNTARFSLGGE